MVTSKQKLYTLLDVIADKLVVTPSDSPIYIDPKGDLKESYTEEELNIFLHKLQHDEKVLKITKLPRIVTGAEKDFFYRITVHVPAFNEYYSKIKKQPDYKIRSYANLKDKDIVYEISYTWTNEILLNKVVLLAQPNSDSINNLVFALLFKNPNKPFTKNQIQDEINQGSFDLHKIVEKLGFTGDIKNLFFGKVAKNLICFRNPITKKDLENSGISRIEPFTKKIILQSQIR